VRLCETWTDRQTDGQCVFYIHHSRKKTRWKTQFLELFTHIVKWSLNGNGFLKDLTTKHPNLSHRVCFCQGDCFFMTLCIVLYCSVFRYTYTTYTMLLNYEPSHERACVHVLWYVICVFNKLLSIYQYMYCCLINVFICLCWPHR